MVDDVVNTKSAAEARRARVVVCADTLMAARTHMFLRTPPSIFPTPHAQGMYIVSFHSTPFHDVFKIIACIIRPSLRRQTAEQIFS